MHVETVHGKQLAIWAIDFETFYDTRNKYSLGNKKTTTVQYVRDTRFKAHGCSYVSPTGGYGWITYQDLPAFFASIDWGNHAFLAHNTAFDGLIAFEHYGVRAGYYLDTLSMARGLWGPGVSNNLDNMCARLGIPGKTKGVLEKTDGIRDLSYAQEKDLAVYGVNDIRQTVEAYELLYNKYRYPRREMHVIDLTIRAFTNPTLLVDAALCQAEIDEEDHRLATLFQTDFIQGAELSEPCREIILSKGIEGLMRSRACFAELLISRGVMPPMKQKMKGGVVDGDKMTFAFAKNDPALQELASDPRVSDLVAAWTGSKSTLRKTRAQRLLDVTDRGAKTLPIPLNYCGGRTHRWSGGGGEEGTNNPYNPQNLSSGRDGRGTRLRDAIIAPKGYRLVAVDSGQIECRFTAWLGNELELLDDFRHDRDPYSRLASEIFNVPVSKSENTHLRHVGKEGELSLGFGVSWKKLYDTIQTKYGFDSSMFTEEDARNVVSFYRNKRRGIVNLWYDIQVHLQHMCARLCGKGRPLTADKDIVLFKNERVLMPNGLPIWYRQIHYEYDKEKNESGYFYMFRDEWVKIYPAKMLENIVQSIARTAVAEQAVEISRELPIIHLVHDEIIALAREQEADAALKYMVEIMSTSPSWCPDIPLSAEGSHQRSYDKSFGKKLTTKDLLKEARNNV